MDGTSQAWMCKRMARRLGVGIIGERVEMGGENGKCGEKHRNADVSQLPALDGMHGI